MHLRNAVRVRRGSRFFSAVVVPSKRPRASFICTGDEVLTGKIADTNTHTLATRLFAVGIDLTRVQVIPDDEAEIAQTVRLENARVGPTGYVFTSGGIGPTHDDMTYPAVARAFGRDLRLNATIAAAIDASRRAKGYASTDAQNRMAMFPDPCRLIVHPGMWVPTVVVDRVHILPGIPVLFQRMLDDSILQGEVVGAGRLHTARVRTQQPESQLADALAAIAAQYGPRGLKIGSYPKAGHVLVTLEAGDEALVSEATNAVAAAIAGSILSAEQP